LNGIGVKHLSEEANAVRLETTEGFSFTAARVVAATNGFARELMPELAVDPGRAQVLVTKPINNLKVKGTFHYNKGYYYFRNIGDRILFGGGRNLDFEGEKTTEFALTDLVQNRLEYLLKTTIIPDTHFEIEQRWSGIMGLGDVKTTIVKSLSSRIFCAVRMGGMGVAIGSLVGEEAAAMIVKSND
ncbi:MAG TPA: FAD-dependent oxidoreductase, partial [Bacteroidia bacterium]|nr:FAD-dependent oxidoreductase [Bacteroidia bacterium]